MIWIRSVRKRSRVTYPIPTLTIAGIVTTPSSMNGATFWRHERRMPSARRIDALYSANVAAPRRPRGPSYGR